MGFGERQVPDASMMADASISLPSERRSRNGAAARPAVRTFVRTLAGDRGDRDAVSKMRGDRRVRREWSQVVGDQVVAGWKNLRIGRGPALSL
jgi:hypothetical protein